MNKEFLETLTILYVEDDPAIRNEFQQSLEKIFKNVLIANDGKEGLEKFLLNNNIIDIIISDINMPKMNGIELLKVIKKHNPDIPFVFTTAHTDEHYLIDAIKYKVDDFFVKPTGLIEIMEKVEKICSKKIQKQKIKQKQNETQEYFDLINKVAIVYIINHEGKIIFTNDFLTELLGIENTDEIYGKDYRNLYHSEMSNIILTEQWNKLQNGEIWKGKIKYLTKSDTAFYTNATIIPTSDDLDKDYKKYISVNFLTTKEENERREFKKQLMYDIQEAKRIFRVAKEKIDTLNKQLEQYSDYDKKEKEYLELREKSKQSFQELQISEKRIKHIKNKFELLTQGVNSKINKVAIVIKNMKDDNEKNTKKIYKLNGDVKIRKQYIEKMKEEIEEKKYKIKNLEDVLDFKMNN